MMSALAPLPLLNPEAPDPRGLGGLLVLVGGLQRPLPLASVRARASVAGDVCRTVIEQHFTNPYDAPLEAIHVFPLPEDGAVVEMELRAGETVVRAECRERNEAEQRYRQAVGAGHRAALLTSERADVHTLRVANLPPKTEATVRLVLVERLRAQDGRMRWRFPTVVAPRYTSGQPVGHEGPGVSPDTDQAPDASRISPPIRLQGGVRLDLEVSVAGPVRSLASSLHALSLELDDGGVRVAPSGQATLNKDFVLSWTTGDASAAALRAWTDGRYTLAVVEPPAGIAPVAMPRDAVFVIDISGSMNGPKMVAAKRALKTALHGLVAGDRFLLLAFDNKLERCSWDFLPYGDAALATADRWIDGLSARGGTEMLPAIQAALAGDTPAGRLRTVLFVTDGQATNEAQLVAAVAGRRKAARFFTLGIDTAVNASLMESLARAGGGVATLCTPSDDIEAVVARIEARFGSPLLTDLKVEGGQPARPEPLALFAGNPASVLLEGAPATLTVRGQSSAGPWSATVAPKKLDFPLGAAWARERVSWLEDQIALKPFQDEALRGEILRVALEHGIASRFTAFVAVDTSVTVTGERVTVVQPVELPETWSEDFRAAPMGIMAPAPGGAPPAPGQGHFVSDLMASSIALDAAKASAPRRRAAAPPPPPMAAAPAPAAPEPPRSSTSLLGRIKDAISLERERNVSPPPREQAADPAATLAGRQYADGSFGGEVARTAAALVLLVLLGHTRRTGLRQRVVLKAARWLGQRSEPVATLALRLLAEAEGGQEIKRGPGWEALLAAGEEGKMLAECLAGR